jgi:hypothetical protein
MEHLVSKQAVIDNVSKVVVNVIELEEGAAWTPPAGCTVVQNDAAGRGGTYVDSRYVPPPDEERPTPKEQEQAAYARATSAEKLRLIATQLGLV